MYCCQQAKRNSTEPRGSFAVRKCDLMLHIALKSKFVFVFCFSVSQADFSEINLASYVNSGCMVDMQVNKGGSKVVR